MQFSLRNHASSDLETLYEIDQACYQPGIAYSRRMLRWYLKLPGVFCVVAEASTAAKPSPVGFIIVQTHANDAYIITIDVLADYRRSGIGTALLQETEFRLEKMGVRRVELQTATNNEAGVAFWLRHGYRSSGVTRGYYLGCIDAYNMFKHLHARTSATA
ncbi:MAG TPA: N-acetyltransferase [Candidatus Acidoferrales bacterium]|jgi:ribosomal-protein-alanine N-acetyltransferase|nr:N-acetyltransferase [Candidatus Acidoferrales bacterium]